MVFNTVPSLFQIMPTGIYQEFKVISNTVALAENHWLNSWWLRPKSAIFAKMHRTLRAGKKSFYNCRGRSFFIGLVVKSAHFLNITKRFLLHFLNHTYNLSTFFGLNDLEKESTIFFQAQIWRIGGVENLRFFNRPFWFFLQTKIFA